MKASDHVLNKEKSVGQFYQSILKQVEKFGDNIVISPVKNGILVKSKSTFLGLKPKKSWLDVEFFSESVIEDVEVFKTLRTSKNRVAHYVRVDEPGQVNKKLIGWLKRSYELVNR
ncbi:MAG: DUF5655 domain-containing protein [Bacteroidota bacterium]